MPTTREQLETAVVTLRGMTDDLQKKSGNPSTAEITALNHQGELVRSLSALTRGEFMVDGLAGKAPANPFADAGDTGASSTASRPWSSPATTRSTRSTGWGEAIVKSATGDDGQFKSLVPSGSVVVPALSPGLVRTSDRPRSILELVPTENLQGTDAYSYLKETVRTHAAAPVAVGALKPTSVYSVAKVDATVKTIAHLSEPIPRQWLADAALLQQYVEGSLREGVELALEDEIVNGPGSGQHFLGLDDEPNHQQQAFSSTMLTTARKAITKLETVQIPSGTFLFAPADWEALELAAESSGNYLMGETLPVDRAKRQLWGMPVVTSTTLTAGVGFLVDFAGSTRLWEREQIRVDWSENTYDPDALGAGEGASDFSRNMIRFRAEGRWGFAVTRPAGVVEIDTAA